MTPITAEEVAQLTACEVKIEKGLKRFVEVGNALLIIRDYRLYRGTHTSFNVYVKDRWGMSGTHAHRMIESAQIVGILPINSEDPIVITPLENSPIGEPLGNHEVLPAPENESSIRPLAQLPKEKVVEIYKRAVQIAGGERPTAAQTKQAVREELESSGTKETKETKEKRRNSHAVRPSTGIQYAERAITQLNKIDPCDTQRTEAFDRVIAWITERQK